jgi:hypothetical protein
MDWDTFGKGVVAGVCGTGLALALFTALLELLRPKG